MVHYLENSSPLWSLLPLFFFDQFRPVLVIATSNKIDLALTIHGNRHLGLFQFESLYALQTSQKVSASRRFTATAKDRILESKWVCFEIAPWKVSIYKPCQVSSAMSRTPLNVRAKSKPFATLRHKELSFFMHVYMYMYMYMYMCICHICIL